MTRDQFICEMMGKCWHEWSIAVPGRSIVCNKCNMRASIHKTYNPAFSTHPADILELQQFVMGAEWYKDFFYHHWVGNQTEWRTDAAFLVPDFIKWLYSDQSRFADLVAEYRGWKE